MSEHPVKGLMDVTLEKIKSMVDASTVVGEPILAGGNTVIPISKITYGFASGGSDFPTKTTKDLFGGGGGAGVTVTPVAFIVITAKGTIKLLQINAKPDTADKIVSAVPDIVDKVSDLIAGRKAKNESDSPSVINVTDD